MRTHCRPVRVRFLASSALDDPRRARLRLPRTTAEGCPSAPDALALARFERSAGRYFRIQSRTRRFCARTVQAGGDPARSLMVGIPLDVNTRGPPACPSSQSISDTRIPVPRCTDRIITTSRRAFRVRLTLPIQGAEHRVDLGFSLTEKKKKSFRAVAPQWPRMFCPGLSAGPAGAG